MNVVVTPWPDRARVVTGTPDLALFRAEELATANAFKLPKRRDEWLLSRAAAKELAVQLGLAADPRQVRVERPFLAGTDWYVSLSHSEPYAGAAIAREPIGVDVQVVRELAESATHLFLSEDEDAAMRRCAIAHRVLHFWCAKEAAFKQRSSDFATLKELPLRLVRESDSGLVFDAVETFATGEVIIALAT